ncbi:MAG TPA: hypothetical protein VHF50_07255 [Solirubrobacterales bacterium]|nr:hypothetical protein [Solirubrobacterales bacterium]
MAALPRFGPVPLGYPSGRMGLGQITSTVTAPVRIGLSAGELALEVALGVVRGTRRALERDGDGAARQPSWPPPPPAPSREPAHVPRPRSTNGSSASTTAAPPKRRPEAVEPPPPVPPAQALGDAVPVIPPPPGAKEVDDAPEPVAEFSESGAEDGAGAEVRVDPPWDGYDKMTAAQIQQRLAKADREVVAAVSLYEGMQRGRRSVVGAAERRLRALSGPSAS